MPGRSGPAAHVPPAPAEPWSHAYDGDLARFVASAIGDTRLLPRFRDGEALPDGFGRGYDERVVEFPSVLAHPLGGRLINAGSTLNHRHILESVRPRVDELLIVALAPGALVPGSTCLTSMRISRPAAPRRRLRLRALDLDLEHIGMSNERYGSDRHPPRTRSPRRSWPRPSCDASSALAAPCT